MPYRSMYGSVDPTEQYRGSNFDPLTGRLQGGNMVLEFLARIAGQKEKKKQEGWDIEDREFQQQMRPLQMQQAQQGITRGQQEIQGYRPPLDPLVELLEGRNVEEKKHKREIELIKERGKVTKEVNLAKPTRTATELNDDYLADVAEVEKQYAGMEVSARGELQKAMTALVNNRMFSPETFSTDVQDAKNQYKEYLDTIAAKKEISLRSIDERYSDLPRARLSASKRGKTKPAAAPPAAQGIQTKGQIKRAQVGKNPIKVGPDGKKYTKINGEIYEVID